MRVVEQARPMRRVIACMASVVFLTAVVACGDTGEPTASGSTAASSPQEPRSGGTLTVVDGTDIESFDPAVQTAISTARGPRLTSVFDALALENAATGAVDLRIAESIQSEDAVTWTLTLRPGITFTDGTSFDAEAVKFNWERMAAPPAEVASISVLDPLTVVIELDAPNAEFARVIAGTPMTWIGSPTAIEAQGDDFGRDPVGAGPYMVERWVRDSELVLVRNPDYYGETYLDQIVMRIVPDDAQRVATLQSGEADIAISTSSRLSEQATAAGLDVVRHAPSGGRTLLFNQTRPPFDDIRARRAITLAFDADAMNEALFGGQEIALHQMLRPESPYHNPDATQPSPDAAEAQRLFDELAAEGTPLEFSLMVYPVAVAEAEWFVGVLESYENVAVSIEVPDVLEVLPRQIRLEYEMSLGTVLLLDPSTLYDYLSPEGRLFGVSGNYDNPEVVDAVTTARGSFDEEVRQAAYATIQEQLVEDSVFPFYEALSIYYAFDGEVVGGIEPENMYAGVCAILWDRLWRVG